MDVGYYPGCSLESSAVEYNRSIKEICGILDIGLKELKDWNCCGASSAHCVDEEVSFLLSARNLEIAEEQGLDILVPCAGCFNHLKAAEKNVLNKTHFSEKSSFQGSIKIMDMLSFLSNEDVLNNIKEKIVKPLKGLKIAAYYGCLSVRPPKIVDSIDHENPMMMENIMTVLGAEVVDWSFKTVCCGGALTLTRTDIVRNLTYKIFNMAEELGVDCLVTSCPMCQANLDTREAEVSKKFSRDFKIPILYFSELIGLALGSKLAKSWFKKHLVNPVKILKRRGLL